MSMWLSLALLAVCLLAVFIGKAMARNRTTEDD